MAVPRASAFRNGLRGFVFRRAGTQSRTQAWKQIGRRQYASDHSPKQSSEIPWIIGSIAFTVPSAFWLLGQGPQGGGHHGESHDEGHEAKEPEDDKDGSKEDAQEESDSKDEKKGDKKDDKKAGKKDDKSAEDSDSESSDDEGDKKDTPNTSDDSDSDDDDSKQSGSKSSGSGKSGDKKSTETKGEKDAAGDRSGAKHPYIDDPEKSKKAGGSVTDTAKAHGTVDTSKTGKKDEDD